VQTLKHIWSDDGWPDSSGQLKPRLEAACAATMSAQADIVAACLFSQTCIM
jgi:hypothetical protein